MKLSLTLAFLSAASSALAFSPLSTTNPTFLSHQTIESATTTTTTTGTSSALFASRKKQKIVSRTTWAEARGIASETPSATAVADEESNVFTNEEGLKYVKLTSGNSSADIYLYGGVVTSYIQNGVRIHCCTSR
jgi:hypothetical protein